MMELHDSLVKKGYCVGPGGFACKSETAKHLETLLKQVEQDGFTYKRSLVVDDKPELIPGSWTEISVVSDGSVDSDYEVVNPKGLVLDSFKKNPVVFWGHDYSQPPVGNALWTKYLKDSANIKTKFNYPKRPEYVKGEWPAEQVWGLIEAKVLKGKSIGFLPTEKRPINQKDIDLNPSYANAKTMITKGELFEISVVGLPANRNALVEAIAKGMSVSEAIKASFELSEDEGLCDLWEWDEVIKPIYCRSVDAMIEEMRLKAKEAFR